MILHFLFPDWLFLGHNSFAWTWLGRHCAYNKAQGILADITKLKFSSCRIVMHVPDLTSTISSACLRSLFPLYLWRCHNLVIRASVPRIHIDARHSMRILCPAFLEFFCYYIILSSACTLVTSMSVFATLPFRTLEIRCFTLLETPNNLSLYVIMRNVFEYSKLGSYAS